MEHHVGRVLAGQRHRDPAVGRLTDHGDVAR
jgi:hypothetical protein